MVKSEYGRLKSMHGTGFRAIGPMLVVALLCVLVVPEAPAQTESPGSLLILRTQAASILEEGWHQLADSLLRPGDIRITVEGGSAKRIVENAFLEFLGRRGFRPLLTPQEGSRSERIQIVILEQLVQFKPLENGNSQREIRTVLEMRRTRAADEHIVYGGPYRRRVLDTVAVRDDGGLGELRNADERSFVDRMLGPVLLIGGAFLIVYLFFTVRN